MREIDAEIERLSDLLIGDTRVDAPRLRAISRLRSRRAAPLSEAQALGCAL